jgi:DNA-binding MarR family transcriptional regulator
MKKNGKNGTRGFKAKKRFHGLASFRLHMLSNVSERLIETRYRRKFGLRMVEVGIIAEVGASGPLSFKNTYIKTDLDKSNASRLAARLLENGLLKKRVDPGDQRSFFLTLTPAGEKLYGELYADALARNQQWMGALTKKQRVEFLSCLDLLTRHTRELLQEELNAPGTAEMLEDRAQEITHFKPSQRILVDAALVRTALAKK